MFDKRADSGLLHFTECSSCHVQSYHELSPIDPVRTGRRVRCTNPML